MVDRQMPEDVWSQQCTWLLSLWLRCTNNIFKKKKTFNDGDTENNQTKTVCLSNRRIVYNYFNDITYMYASGWDQNYYREGFALCMYHFLYVNT